MPVRSRVRVWLDESGPVAGSGSGGSSMLPGRHITEIDLNLLVVLDALLTERNVTRAGRRVYLSQPGASAALGRLRRLFEDPLLVSRGRRLELTPLASSLVDPVREALRGVERALNVEPESDPRVDVDDQ
jgi:LysR family transcriptional regulator, nod-box dependent transcriptional activator